jgi:hypothetical protein
MIIFVTVAITALIGFAGLSTDAGMIWITRARLQNSVDAAVLAAAQELPAPDAAGEVAPRDVACEYATEHNAVLEMFGKNDPPTCSGEADVTFEDGGNTIRVKAYREVEPIFGQVLGFDEVEVWAQAKATVGSLGAACLFPLFITEQVLTANPDFYAPVAFTNAGFNKVGNDDGGIINLGGGGGGANELRDAMVNPTCTGEEATTIVGTVGEDAQTKPGAFDQIKAAWDAIAAAAVAAGSACPDEHVSTYLTLVDGEYVLDPAITLASCPRISIIPVLENGDYDGGGATGEIVGFIPFYFALKCGSNTCDDPDAGPLTKNDFWGYFVRLDASGLGVTEYDPTFGITVVALAD